MRARAVSRFYIALPLSSVVMGSVAGWLLGLQGKLGLAGWQWLFLLEGLPAALFSLVILEMLPDGPAQGLLAHGARKRRGCRNQLEADGAQAHLGHDAGVTQALLSPQRVDDRAYFFFALTTAAMPTASLLRQFCRESRVGASPMSDIWWRVLALLGRSAMLAEQRALGSHRRAGVALHRALLCNGRWLLDSELCARQPGWWWSRSAISFCCVHVAAGPGDGGAHAVSRRARRRRGNCRHEHHHHVQRIRRPLLDGRDERLRRAATGGAARGSIMPSLLARPERCSCSRAAWRGTGTSRTAAGSCGRDCLSTDKDQSEGRLTFAVAGRISSTSTHCVG